MKGKILFGLVCLAFLGVYISGYPVVSTFNHLIETAVGAKVVTVDELRELAEEGKIPYEVYRLAEYEKLKNPDIFFQYSTSNVFSKVLKVLFHHNHQNSNKVYVIERGSSSILQGRYVERINDSWYRVVIVMYDKMYAGKYGIFAVNVSTELRSGYVVDSWFPSYLKFLRQDKGIIEAKEKVNDAMKSNTLILLVYRNVNSEDWRIAEKFASQILDFARENNLTRTQAAELAYGEFVPRAADYISDNDWIPKPFTFLALDGDKLVRVRLNASDSLMKSYLLYGKGSCYLEIFTAVHILESMGISCADLALINEEISNIYHARLAIPYDQLKVNELKHPKFIRPAVIEVDKKQTQWIVYDIGLGLADGYRTYLDSLDSDKPGYLIYYLPCD